MSPAPSPVLEVRGLRIRRGGADVLELPALAVAAGEILALIGPNGAGKSTLLLALSGIEAPAAGELRFRGESVRGGASSLPYRRRIAMVFQEPLLFDTTVAENVASGLRLRGVPRAESLRRAGESLERFSIAHLAGRSARTLSGGEAQRTSLARAFAVRPEVLLLDEPFAALDAPTRETLLDDLERTLRETGTTTVFATHDRGEAQRLADRVAVLHQGRVRQTGAVEEVMRRPADAFVAAFVGVENLVPGRILRSNGDGECVGEFLGREFGFQSCGLGAGREALLCIRPEDVALGPAAAVAAGRSGAGFPGTVASVSAQGPWRRVVVECGCRIVAAVPGRTAEETGIAAGRPVTVHLRPGDLHVIPRA